jgi:hypothetical protein
MASNPNSTPGNVPGVPDAVARVTKASGCHELCPIGWTGLRYFELTDDGTASIELIESEAE